VYRARERERERVCARACACVRVYVAPVSKLLLNYGQVGIKLTQRLMTNSVPSAPAISSCFANKACIYNLTAN